jgi:hypothetical protein
MSIATFFFHQGMVICGVPYSSAELLTLDEMSGGTPYGATTIAGPRGERHPSANELTIARAQGRHVATIATKLARGEGSHVRTLASWAMSVASLPRPAHLLHHAHVPLRPAGGT